MNDSHPKIVLVQSRLPYTDRRALSEAWFSALHLVSDGPPSAAPPERRFATSQRTFAPPAGGPTGARAVLGCVAPAATRPRQSARAASPAAASHVAPARNGAARQRGIAAAPKPAGQAAKPFCTSLTIALETGRVQLLLRREGGTLHVIALCRPNAADTVARALALAGVHLRIRGESVRCSVRACDATEVLA